MDWPAAFLLFATLGGLAGCAPAEPPGRINMAAAGARIYSGNCVACHQENGRGVTGVYPSLAGSPVVLGDTRELALWVVDGVRPAGMPIGRYPTAMRQFTWMKAADAAALLTYVRSHFGNAEAAVDVQTMREVLGP